MRVECDSTWNLVHLENGETWKLNRYSWRLLMEVLLTPKQLVNSEEEDFWGEVSNKRFKAAESKYKELKRIFKL